MADQASAREELLGRLFADILRVPRVGREDNFFSLGGDSLQAVRLANRISSVLGVEVNVRSLFETPTVAEVAALLKDSPATGRPPLVQAERPAFVPLSSAQSRLWFLHRLEGPSAAYNLPVLLRLSGTVQQDALRAALADVVGRHESLRTVFPEYNGAPYQRILEADRSSPGLDISTATEAALPSQVRCVARHTFDLSSELPIRACLFEVTPSDHLLALVLHHVAADEWSLRPLLRDLSTAYSARCAGEAPLWAALPVQYADYALWQSAFLGDTADPASVLARQLAHWKDALDGLPAELALPTDRARPAVPSYRGGSVPLQFTADLHTRLRRSADHREATLFMVLHAGLAALLTRLGAGTDIPLGTPVAGRREDILDELVGFFVNTLVLRVSTAGDPSFHELVNRARVADVTAYAHQDVPFERLVQELSPLRSSNRNPLFQVMLTLSAHNVPVSLPGIRAIPCDPDIGVAKFDLNFSFREQFSADGEPAGMTGSLVYAEDLFDCDTAERMGRYLVRLLNAVTADPDLPVGQANMLAATELDILLRTGTGPRLPVPAATVTELIEAQVARAPDAVAVTCQENALTYRELNDRADALAGHLAQHDVGPEKAVAVALARSELVPVALLAVLKSGGVYLPLDLDNPAERLEFMIRDVAPAVLLTSSATAAQLPEVGVPTVVIDDPGKSHDATPGRQPHPARADHRIPVRPANAAYIIHTSGSTGKPKGVVVTHMGIPSLVADLASRYRIGPGSRVLQFAALGFDVSVKDMAVALVSGATLVLLSAEQRLSGGMLGKLVADLRITHASLTPSVLATLPSDSLPAGMTVLAGGEACALDLVRRFAARQKMFNGYGPTEFTIVASAWACSSDAPDVLIGRPIANTRIYILDSDLRPVPGNVLGELYIAGPGLARGYFGRPGLTAERFLPCPFGAPGERMYRTGDLARWRADGNIEFAGRADSQLKLRGFRIEPGEIEAVLAGHRLVGRAAVVLREDSPGEKRLVAYVTLVEHAVIDPGVLRSHAAAALPPYMVPAACVVMPELPLTPSGKLDAAALPAPEFILAVPRVDPGSAAEQALCRLFADVLGVPGVGLHDDFFELGGHSLLAARLGNRIHAELGVQARIRDIFETRTVAGLAARIGHESTDLGPGR